MLYSPENVSFNIICLDVLEGRKYLHLLMRFQEYQLETPFKADDRKCINNNVNFENLNLYFL